MIIITPAAAEQIRTSAAQGNMEGMAIRIAARREPDGSIHYGMGFDDDIRENDIRLTAEGIELIVSETTSVLVGGMTVDFVEIEPGSHQFIFLNPNDANYAPPAKD